MVAIAMATPMKEGRTKHNFQEWFHDEISEAIKIVISYSKNLENLRYISIRNYIIRFDIRYTSQFSI